MSRFSNLRRLSRGLRFRLTAAYALFFAVPLMIVAVVSYERFATSLDNQTEETLNEQWGAMKASFLRIEMIGSLGRYAASWYYDDTDPDETTVVLDIKKIYMIADQYGNVIPEAATKDPAVSTAYQDMGVDKPADIRARVQQALASPKAKPFWAMRRDARGQVQIRYGIVWDENHRAPYYVAIGASLADNAKILRSYTWVYAGVIPGALIVGSFLGWVMAGRSLRPVRDVAQTAQRISGSNLSLRIPDRQSGDELDYLILTFNGMIERLEASFQQIKQFSTDVSHELRTPITAIRGQLEVALFTAKTTDQYREAMFNALQDIDRLSQIVRALLLLSQADTGQLALQKSRQNLCEIVQDLVEQFQIPAEAVGVRLTGDTPDDCFALVDRVQMERMITNLLSNAIKFTPEKGRVRVRLRPFEDRIEIIVEDTGRGIPPEYQAHIFDRFYRVPGSGTAPGPEQGLGLGLSFVAWIVKAHDGKIDVESVPGKGTRFTITLPAAEMAGSRLEEVTSHA
jgi:heavy metal sensor kinase